MNKIDIDWYRDEFFFGFRMDFRFLLILLIYIINILYNNILYKLFI